MRFRLADERVQNLLMREQLYPDPALAVRELYQNAIDACRHADARTTYLQRTAERISAPTASPRDQPRVVFEQGFDVRGQEFIRCTDTGVGMGVEELESAFAVAGIRSLDRPEFIDETAEYASLAPPISLFTNSQFGIGVLSYFMIAEKIELTTTRLNRDGSLGDELGVEIVGPAAEFTVEKLARGHRPGTTVTLWLKPDTHTSSVATLRDLIIVCPYEMEASTTSGLSHYWQAGEVNMASRHITFETAPFRQPGGRVWFVDGWGPVLADGIWAESFGYGTMINLTGRLMPRLTVDRRRILEYDEEATDELVVGGIEYTLADIWEMVGKTTWLDSTFRFSPKLVDAIIEAAAQHGGLHIELRGRTASVEVCGYMIGDGLDQALDDDRATGWAWSRFLAGTRPTVAPIVAEKWADVVAARPSDAVFLGRAQQTIWGMVEQPVSRWRGDPRSVYDAEMHLRWPVSRIVERARQLGLVTSEKMRNLPESNDFIRTLLLLSAETNEDRTSRAVPVIYVLRSAWQHDMTRAEAAHELALRDIEASPELHDLIARPPSPGELLPVTHDLDEQRSSFEPGHASGRRDGGFGSLPDQGYAAPILDGRPLKKRHLRIASVCGYGRPPYREPGSVISPYDILELAARNGRSIEKTCRDARRLGFTVAEFDEWRPRLRPGDD